MFLQIMRAAQRWVFEALGKKKKQKKKQGKKRAIFLKSNFSFLLQLILVTFLWAYLQQKLRMSYKSVTK